MLIITVLYIGSIFHQNRSVFSRPNKLMHFLLHETFAKPFLFSETVSSFCWHTNETLPTSTLCVLHGRRNMYHVTQILVACTVCASLCTWCYNMWYKQYRERLSNLCFCFTQLLVVKSSRSNDTFQSVNRYDEERPGKKDWGERWS